jgi:hypothetical protein
MSLLMVPSTLRQPDGASSTSLPMGRTSGMNGAGRDDAGAAGAGDRGGSGAGDV